jgi:hypothetical protein
MSIRNLADNATLYEFDAGATPFLNVASGVTTTFGGLTKVNNYFQVDPDNNGAYNFQIGGGYCTGNDNLYWDVPGSAGPEFVIDNLGNQFYDPNGSTPGGIIFQNNLTFNERAVHHTMDRDNNGFADVDFQTNGPILFNTDADAANEFVFGSNFFGMDANFVVNPSGGTVPEVVVGPNDVKLNADDTEPADFDLNATGLNINKPVSIDANQDGTPETTFEDDLAEFGNTVFVINPDGGVTEMDVKTGEVTVYSKAWFKGETFFDPNADGIDDMVFSEVNNAPRATINGDLEVTGNKNFIQPHPTDPTKEIVYVALEGGEAGTYTRGSGTLVDGIAIIELPEHFGLVTNAEGLTAQITPRGPVHAMLYVESVTPRTLVVRASTSADAHVPFDYLINGIREGFENHQVIRDRQRFSASH